MPNIEPFEEHADRYDDWFEKHAEIYRAELEAIRQLMPPPGVEGLEIGVGSGKFAVPLGVKTGVEPAGEMARRAEARGVKVYRGVAEALPFDDARFGLVLIVTTICFVDDPLKALRESYRVLEPGGNVIVGFVDKNSELGRRYEKKRASSVFYKDASFLSSKEVAELLRAAGFQDLEFRQTLLSAEDTDTVESGFGKGSFVALRGAKPTGV